MTLEEAEKRFEFPTGTLKKYISLGFIKPLKENAWEFKEEDFAHLGLIDTLLGIGFTSEEIIQRNIMVIPKSVHREHMEENFHVFDFALTENEMKKITELDTGNGLFMNHRDPEVVSRLGNTRFDI